ncbi:transcriptional regulator [Streptantibioticus silvisoli]|uniref:Transcriptional regulator n=1 Tax=Streptantibioticus silvisoli TaxID=2705255 RepID=A0ABT6W5P0_9ACTN|nr:transcriptional regulator [Streptantibioticus silvisoli]MDI5966071.1 transcriptional regulator [Streptantibioticus silvisoli]
MLARIAAQHQALGYGRLSARPEKWSRWTRENAPVHPTEPTQLAIAAVVGGVTPDQVRALGWPAWIHLALRDDHTLWESPWTVAGTIEALDHTAGGHMDRRGFLTTITGGTLSAVMAHWALADPATAAATSGTRVGADVADACDTRLGALRHLDDALGAGPVYDAALAELRLLGTILRNCSYRTDTARRLFGCAAEASRIAGWCRDDSGSPIAAQAHYATALRASASGGDRTTGALITAFWANTRYAAAHDPRSALDLIDTALRTTRNAPASPRVTAMLHIRRARAHSLMGEPSPAYRAIDAALHTYESGVPTHEDLPTVYWMNTGEVLQAAGSAALSLNDPRRALSYFDTAYTHPDPYRPDIEARGAAIYAARRAEAYLALGERDAAVETTRSATTQVTGVTSDRAAQALTSLHDHLNFQGALPADTEVLVALRRAAKPTDTQDGAAPA